MSAWESSSRHSRDSTQGVMERTSEKNSVGTEQAGVGTGRRGNQVAGNAKGKESQIIMAKKRDGRCLTIPILICSFTCRPNHQYHKNHSAVHTPNRINTGQRYDPAPGRPNAFGPFTTPISRAFLYPSSTVLLLMLFSCR